MEPDVITVTGGRPLSGSVPLSGSKNGSLPVLAATLLMQGECLLEHLPGVADVNVMGDILKSLGLRVSCISGDTWLVSNDGISSDSPPEELIRRMRGSFYVLGPLLARLGRANVSLPGGCYLGSRPVDYVLEVFRALGAETPLDGRTIRASSRRLAGAGITLNPRYRSPGATFHALMGSVLAEGETTIGNASHEPDVISFCHFLNKMGARIAGMGTDTLTVQGVESLVGCPHRVLSDRVEAGTFLLAACMTRGEVTAEDIEPAALSAVLDELEKAGAKVIRTPGSVTVSCPERMGALDVRTGPEPEFPTDLQPPLVAALCTADGSSRVEETIFEDRLRYAHQLARMGAKITVEGMAVSIEGVESLRGGSLLAENIRAGAALVLAALAARGNSRISGRDHIVRGYQDFERKLSSLGARISVA
jgi:UDP-N-acetylglucosamine 1-carboxyvinyltransferase